MNRKLIRVALAIGGLLVTATAARAHHSFAAVFDETKSVEVKGVMAEIKIENPHSWFYVNVTDATGKVTKWGFEGNTPTSLIRAGYKRDSLKVGDRVTVKGVRARDVSAPMGAAREITLDGGPTFIVGPKGAADAQ